jgi:hypothetical protein
LELQAVDPAATFESCANHGIGEIRELISDHHGGEHSGHENTDGAGQSGGENLQNHPADDGCQEAGHHGEGEAA